MTVLALLIGCGGGGHSGIAGEEADSRAPADLGVLDAAPDLAPAARLLHVESGAADGDGSRERPFPDLERAFAEARAGDTVFLLPGRYAAPEDIPTGLILSGSGVDVSHVDGPLRLTGPIELRELSIEGGAPALAVELSEASVVLDAVRIATAAGPGLHLERGEVDARALRLEIDGGEPAVRVGANGTLRWRGGGALSAGPGIITAGRLIAESLDLSSTDGEGIGVHITGGESRLARISVVARSVAGLLVEGGQAVLEDSALDRVVDEGATAAAVRVRGGSVELRGVTVRGSTRGLRVDADGALDASEVEVLEPGTDGLSVQGGEATVLGLRVTAPGNAGVAALAGARLHLEDATITAPRRIGLLADGATIEAATVTVLDSGGRGITLSRASGAIDGLRIERAADGGVQITDPSGPLALRGGEVLDCAGPGVSIFGDAPEDPVQLSGLTVEGTRPGAGGLSMGIQVYQASAHIADSVSRASAGAGLTIEQAQATVVGLEAVGNAEPGVVVLDARGPVLLERSTLRTNQGAGLLAANAELTLLELEATENRANLAIGPGHGVHGVLGARIQVTDGALTHNVGSGLAVEAGNRAELGGVRLEGNGAYGVQASCGAELAETATNVYGGNALGDRNLCE